MVTIIGRNDGFTYTYENRVLTITGNGQVVDMIGGYVNPTEYVWNVSSGELDATGMTKLILNDGITGITQEFTKNCGSLTEIRLPKTLTSIPYDGLRSTSIETVRIPASVENIYNDAFYSNRLLKNVIFEGTTAPTFQNMSIFTGMGTLNIYSSGWADSSVITPTMTPNVTVTFYDYVPTAYKKITLGDYKVQVDSAVRDEDGVRIKTNYAKKSEVTVKLDKVELASGSGHKAYVALDGGGQSMMNVDYSNGSWTLCRRNGDGCIKVGTPSNDLDATPKSYVDGKRKIISNTSVSSWSSDNTYSDYPYRASIAITGVTASDTAEVIFGVAQATSGDYAPVCETYAGGIYVYSAVNDSITIPTIIIFKG